MIQHILTIFYANYYYYWTKFVGVFQNITGVRFFWRHSVHCIGTIFYHLLLFL